MQLADLTPMAMHGGGDFDFDAHAAASPRYDVRKGLVGDDGGDVTDTSRLSPRVESSEDNTKRDADKDPKNDPKNGLESVPKNALQIDPSSTTTEMEAKSPEIGSKSQEFGSPKRLKRARSTNTPRVPARHLRCKLLCCAVLFCTLAAYNALPSDSTIHD
jgi:hypothetical protein